jgi:hypothetical protein
MGHPPRRGQSLSVAATAASVPTRLAYGVTRFRTGGSSDEAAILSVTNVVGSLRAEEWVTLEPSGRPGYAESAPSRRANIAIKPGCSYRGGTRRASVKSKPAPRSHI